MCAPAEPAVVGNVWQMQAQMTYIDRGGVRVVGTLAELRDHTLTLVMQAVADVTVPEDRLAVVLGIHVALAAGTS